MNKIQKLPIKIAQLEKQNSQLRAGFYEIIELAYEAVNAKCYKNHTKDAQHTKENNHE